MKIYRMTQKHYSSWLMMRKKLWPSCTEEEHNEEIRMQLAQPDKYPGFIALDDFQNPIGFLEASIHDYTPGCHSSPVGYIEGWYVEQANRKLGVGKELVKTAENWFADKGYQEMASDAELDNRVSIEAHKRLGYAEVGEVDGCIQFLKQLPSSKQI